MSYQSTTILGNVGNDADMRYTPAGAPGRTSKGDRLTMASAISVGRRKTRWSLKHDTGGSYAGMVRQMREQGCNEADCRFILRTLGIWDQFIAWARKQLADDEGNK